MNLLFLTGYLTRTGRQHEGLTELRIPNAEVRECISKRIEQFFSGASRGFVRAARSIYDALLVGRAPVAQAHLQWLLARYISVCDAGGEAFYHGFLLGVLTHAYGASMTHRLHSNIETGDGFSDVVLTDAESSTAAVLEIKYTRDDTEAGLSAACEAAIAQIHAKRYAQALVEPYESVRTYGVAFSGKHCLVRAADSVLT